MLRDLDLHLEAGERVLVAGASGSGKSTLLRALAGLLLTADVGDLSGEVLIGGRPAGAVPGDVGLLLQDPAAGVVAETVGRDVAFGLENRAVPREQIWPRVAEALEAAAFPYGPRTPTRALSGGELQRLALAGTLALGSRVLLLDEPTSMLDADAADAVRRAVRDSVERSGTTTVVVEHHLGPWLDFATRLVVLAPDGRLLADGPPAAVLDSCGRQLAAAGLWVPGLPAPVAERLSPGLVEPYVGLAGALVEAEDLHVTLRGGVGLAGRRTSVALRGVDAAVTAGRCLGVTGDSGAGKSTLLSALAGLQRPTAGRVRSAAALATARGRDVWRWRSRDLAARLAWVPQLPETGVVASTVRDEVRASARASGRPTDWTDRRCDALLEALGLSALAQTSPYHLSGGEQRRLMVAAALGAGPSAALWDEPTVGQDRHTWASVVSALVSARDAGVGAALATHDATAIDAAADVRVALRAGAAA